MLCLLTIRRLKSGAHEEFAKSWMPERWHGRLARAYHVRNQDDPDEGLTVAFFEGTPEEIDAMRDDPEWMAGEERRLRRRVLPAGDVAGALHQLVAVDVPRAVREDLTHAPADRNMPLPS